MLKNYDKRWRQDLRDGETPSYINVPPGDYFFQVRGANSLGIWNMKGVTLHITILPPWWKSNWAYFGFFLAVVGSIWAFVQYRSRALRKQNEALEHQVNERTTQLKQSLDNLKMTQAQLIQSEKLASLGELTAGIAHEIQNPLNFVNNFAEVSAEMVDEMHEELEKGDTIEAIAIATDLKTNLEKINHHGQRASSIVKGMLEHSRPSSGVKEPSDINALADEFLRLAYHGLRAKDDNFNATMETHFDPDLPKVSVIPQDIGRVLLNLINNAFYAVTEKAKQGIEGYQPSVTISSQKLENAIEIRVQDNGNGIPEAIRDKIFQPFFTTKPTGQGPGLGLSLAYDIVVKGHGGSLEVTSNEGLGSAFVIQLSSQKI
jgi:signal transduction histidine kinase